MRTIPLPYLSDTQAELIERWKAKTCDPCTYSLEQGGGLLADLILGHEPVCAVEWEPYCCAVLRERAADGWFPGLHVHEGDVRLFDPSEWSGRVDCIHAGFPCQDISVAGSGAGIDGERSGLYREVLRIADVVRPRFLFLENSPAIVGRGLGTVLGDLAARGYDARWTVLAAADVGAPHIRERWWCLGWRADDHGSRELQPEGRQPDERGRSSDVGLHVPDANESGRVGRPTRNPTTGPEHCDGPSLSRAAIPDANQARLEIRQHGDAGQRAPAVGSGWWGAEPDVGRVAPGVAARVDQIKALGNGQVPLCAAAAYKLLGGP